MSRPTIGLRAPSPANCAWAGRSVPRPPPYRKTNNVIGLLIMGLVPFLGTFAAGAVSDSAASPVPRRIHIARGLWWEHWRLHEAVARIGGARCEASWDVYGNTQGYSGCGTPLSDFPKTEEALRGYDLIVLTGFRAAVLPADAQKRLAAWVEGGGGLLVMGGIHGFGSGGWKGTPLESILPVDIGDKPDLRRAAVPMASEMTPAGTAVLGVGAAASGLGAIYYYHADLVPKKDSQSWMVGGGKPLLLVRQAGRGRVAVCAATVCGEPMSNQPPLFCESAGWPVVLAATLNWLMPARETARAVLASGDPKDPRLVELASLSELDVDSMLDMEDGGDKGGDGKSGDQFARIRKLASPCGGSLHALAVVKALTGSATRFGAREALALDEAIGPGIQGTEFEGLALKLTRSGNSGQTALGLMILGRLRSTQFRAVAEPVITRGVDGLVSKAVEGMGSLRPPDGENEYLRLAAVRAALASHDPELLKALKSIPPPLESGKAGWALLAATDNISRGDGQLTLERQLAAEALAARAVLGDPEAAPSLLRMVIRQRLEAEALLDAIQMKWARDTLPADAARRKRQGEALAPRQALVSRLMDAVAQIPAASYPAIAVWAGEAAAFSKRPVTDYPVLAGRVNEGTGEIPMECLMTALADRGIPLSSEAREALRQIGDQSLMPEIRALCEGRLSDSSRKP